MHGTHGSGVQPLAGQPQPLAAMIQRLVADDAELLESLDEARRRRLPRLAVLRLAPTLSLADFTREALTRFGDRTSAPVWGVGVVDPWASWLSLNIRRRIAELVTEVFDQLRLAELDTTGLQVATGARVRVPGDVWWSGAAAVDMRTNAFLLGGATLFLDVVTEPVAPKPSPRLSVAAIERFVTTFAAELLAAGRRFSSAELLAAAEAEGIGPSANVVGERLRRLKPTAWARRGRRSAVEVPTPIEIAAAAGQASEAVNHR